METVSAEPLIIRAWIFSEKIPSWFEDINNMLTEFPEREMHRGTAIEALHPVKNCWKIKGAFFKMVLGQLHPRRIAFRIIARRMTDPWIITTRTIAPEENCNLTIKFHSKIIALTQASFSKEYYEWTDKSYALSTSTIIYE